MDENTIQRLSEINDKLIQLCHWLNQKKDKVTASRLVPIVDELTALVLETTLNKRPVGTHAPAENPHSGDLNNPSEFCTQLRVS